MSAADLAEFAAADYAAWRAAVEPFLKGAPFEKRLCSKLPGGLTLQPIYFPPAEPPVEEWPGLAPFTRGASPTARVRPLLAQDLVATRPEAFHRELMADLMAGLNCVPIRLDEPGGLAAASEKDWRTVLDGVDLTAAPPVVRGGAGTAAALKALVAQAARSPLTGVVAWDPVTPGPEAVGDFASFAAFVRAAVAEAPAVRTVRVRAGFWTEAGGSAVQEIAFGLATAVDVLRHLAALGVSAAEAALRVVFEVSLQSDIFPQMAKLRALRWLWSGIQSACGLTPVPALIHGFTTGVNKSVLDPHTNLLRATGETFAGLCAGVDILTVAPHDAPAGPSSEVSRRLARNVPIILAEECGLRDVADPAGGAWYAETLTSEMAAAAWEEFQGIERLGGMVAALAAEVPQQAVAAAAAAHRAAMAQGRETLVGVNLSANPGETPSDPPAPRDDLWRAAADYEELRRAAREVADPRVWLATFGPPRQHRARADFSSAFFACAGCTAHSGRGADSVASALETAVASGAPVVVICSTDDTYPDLVPPFARGLKAARPGVRLYVAGAPGDHEAAFREAGVDGFIHVRSNRVETLRELLRALPRRVQS